MKSKFLKSYNSYKGIHMKENVASLGTTSNIASFDKYDEHLEDIKEDSEEVETSTPDVPCDSCQKEGEQIGIGIGTEEEKKVETLPAPVIGQITVATEIEIPTDVIADLPQSLPISEPTNTTLFNPNQNVEGFTQTAPTPVNTDSQKLFSIVKIMTQNGEKIGMCYTEDVGEYGTPIHNNIDFNAGCELVKQCCSEHSVDEFKSDVDTIVGMIPSFMIPKKNKGLGTSYRPN